MNDAKKNAYLNLVFKKKFYADDFILTSINKNENLFV